MNRRSRSLQRWLNTVLSLMFAVAIVMGAGPGLYLVNPDPSDPAASVTWLGLPILYAWIAFWFLVEALVILLAYFFLWDTTQPDPARKSGSRETPDRKKSP